MYGSFMITSEEMAVPGRWSARAIFHPRSQRPIDLLPDRQEAEGDRCEEVVSWLTRIGLMALQALPAFKQLRLDSCEIVEVRDGPFTLRATPNASYGYLYMVAFVTAGPSGSEGKEGFGTLVDYDTADHIGPATEEQLDASQAAVRYDGGAGVILVDEAGRVLPADDPYAADARRCYVQD